MKHTLETVKKTVADHDGYAFFRADEIDEEVSNALIAEGYDVSCNALETSPGEWLETIDVEWIESDEPVCIQSRNDERFTINYSQAKF